MSSPPYRALRVVLGLLATLVAVGGLTLVLGSRPLIMRLFLEPPASEVTTLLRFTLRELGGIALMLSLMLFFAARNPARNVAIVDAFTAGLAILAITPLISLYTLDLQKLYPASLVWGRSLVRLGLAALLYWLRPSVERRG